MDGTYPDGDLLRLEAGDFGKSVLLGLRDVGRVLEGLFENSNRIRVVTSACLSHCFV